MGFAILLCPSSSSVQLWGQVSPLKKTRQKEGRISLSHSCFRCSANAHCTGDLKRRPAFLLHSASSSETCRRIDHPFSWRRVSAAASGGEVSVEEAAVVPDEAPTEQSESSGPSATSKEEAPVTTEEAPVVTERRTQARRSLNRSNSNAKKATVVSPAELLPGAVFPGKVTSIQTFGAFVDLGAFTNGLVHISRLSKSFVKKVEDVVQIGQDVKVQVLDVDLQGSRISLMLVQEGEEEAPQEGAAAEKQPARSPQQQTRTPRRESSKRQPSQRQAVTTTMKKGEIATGTVKNMIKSGVFITLPDGTDGYLPGSQVIFKGPNTSMEAQFQVGQEVTVRVLRIEKGRVNLTMRREVNFDKLNEDLNKDVVDVATNPFELAFRRNELISSFLADRDKQKAQAQVKEEATKEETVDSVEEVKDVAEVEKPAVKEEEKLADAIDTAKDETVSSEALNFVEEVAELDKPAVVEEEEKGAIGVDAREDTAVSSEAVNSVEEVKAAAELEKPVVEEEEEEEKLKNGVDTVSSEAVNSVEEVKGAAEAEKLAKEDEKVAGEIEAMKEKPAVEKEDEKVAGENEATKDEAVLSEAVISVEEVKDAPESEKLVVKQEDEKVADGVEATKDEAVPSEAVSSVEEGKDVAEVEKPAVEKVDVEVADRVEATKDEAVSSEAVNSDKEVKVKDAAKVEKPAIEEKEEKGVNFDAAKGEAASSEVDAENLITFA